jgi:hypothetical protein
VNYLREAVADLRYRWLGLRIGGPEASMSGQWVVVTVSMLFVFGCFFAIGRVHHGGGGSAPAGAPSAQAAPGSGAVPIGLSGGSPTAGAVPVAIALKPRALPATASSEPSPPATATAQPFVAEAARAAEPQVTSVPAAEATQAPAASKAPAPSRRSGSATAKHQQKPHGGSQSSPAVTFDSSE